MKQPTSKINYYLAFLTGILHSLAYAPFNNILAAITSIILFYLILNRSENLKKVVRATLIFGMTYYICSLHWIVNSLLIEIGQFWYLVPLVLFIIPLFLSLYFLVIAIPTFYFRNNKTIASLVFTGTWVLSELMRSHFFTGFPWNLIGTIWLDYDFAIPIIQNHGIFFLGGMTILFATLLGNIIFFRSKSKKNLIFWMILEAIIIIYAFYPRPDKSIITDNDQKMSFRLVQPNIKQQFKWRQEELDNVVQKNLELSLAGSAQDIQYIIWPETAIPFAVNTDSFQENIYLQYVATHLHPGQYLITGAITRHDKKTFNSILIIDAEGQVMDFYNKRRLVPFGEFIPLHDYFQIPFLSKMIKDFTHLNCGDHEKSMMNIEGKNKLAIHPMICYEAIFPCKNSNHRYNVIINVVNDAWFGDSFGPHQHLRMARVRAIEANLPLLRVANNGISAHINNRGTIIQKLELNQTGYLDVKL